MFIEHLIASSAAEARADNASLLSAGHLYVSPSFATIPLDRPTWSYYLCFESIFDSQDCVSDPVEWLLLIS